MPAAAQASSAISAIARMRRMRTTRPVSAPGAPDMSGGTQDWTPLQNRVNPFKGYNKPDLDVKDPWQFKNFLLTDNAC